MRAEKTSSPALSKMPPPPQYGFLKNAPPDPIFLQRVQDVLSYTPVNKQPNQVFLVPDQYFESLKRQRQVAPNAGAISDLVKGTTALPFQLAKQSGLGHGTDDFLEFVLMHELGHYNDTDPIDVQSHHEDKYNHLADQMLRLYKTYKPMRQADEAFIRQMPTNAALPNTLSNPYLQN